MIKNPAEMHFDEDLLEEEFINGLVEGHWRIISNKFPIVSFAISATEPNGASSEYCFRADLENFPSQAPLVKIWNATSDSPLPPDQRPNWDERVAKTFQNWGDDTVYRPWDRKCGPHDGQAASNTHLAWHANRHFSFILRDMHGILNGNARKDALRKSA